MTYALLVKFKSNAAPWDGGYTPIGPHQPPDDAAAIKWALGIADGLGPAYLVTLTRDGVVIPLRATCVFCDGGTSSGGDEVRA